MGGTHRTIKFRPLVVGTTPMVFESAVVILPFFLAKFSSGQSSNVPHVVWEKARQGQKKCSFPTVQGSSGVWERNAQTSDLAYKMSPHQILGKSTAPLFENQTRQDLAVRGEKPDADNLYCLFLCVYSKAGRFPGLLSTVSAWGFQVANKSLD